MKNTCEVWFYDTEANEDLDPYDGIEYFDFLKDAREFVAALDGVDMSSEKKEDRGHRVEWVYEREVDSCRGYSTDYEVRIIEHTVPEND